MSNSLGKDFKITLFGESHGSGVGVVIDGCPAGLSLDTADIQKEVDKRKPAGIGQTRRAEVDKVAILSGIFEGHTTGTPIALMVLNRDIDSKDYEDRRFIPRPGHADYTALIKYGGFNDFRGGGMFSGRMTVGLVMAGAVAKKLLESISIEILAYTVEIGGIKAAPQSREEIKKNVLKSSLRTADLAADKAMEEAIEKAAKEGDSLGGVIEVQAANVPAGLGEPFFNTLEGEIARALFAIPAIKGVEFGSGFAVADSQGSLNNDAFRIADGKIITLTNNAGGIMGGISNGMPVVVRVAIKPTPSIAQKQQTVDLKKMENAAIEIKGRHDVCIVPRAVVVVEAVMAITLCDFALQERLIPRILK